MTLEDAITLIKPGVRDDTSVWADIGAGTGMFTQALAHLLSEHNDRANAESNPVVYAVDKSPHALWSLKSESEIPIEIVETDFHETMELPPLDGIVMANALHYARDHAMVLKNVMKPLKPGGTFILVEYDTETPKPPWVPNPVSFRLFESLCRVCDLSEPEIIGSAVSRYGYERIYAACVWKR